MWWTRGEATRRTRSPGVARLAAEDERPVVPMNILGIQVAAAIIRHPVTKPELFNEAVAQAKGSRVGEPNHRVGEAAKDAMAIGGSLLWCASKGGAPSFC